MSDDIQEAKRRLPLPSLMERYGLGEHAKKSARCPFHEDGNNSFSVWSGDKGWQFKCHAGCGGGDEITLVEIVESLSNKDATKRFLEMAGVRGERTNGATHAEPSRARVRGPVPRHTKHLPSHEPQLPSYADEWKKAVSAMDDKMLALLCEQRGYSTDFGDWLRNEGLIGLHPTRHGLALALPVHDERGLVIAAHVRNRQKKPDGTPIEPLPPKWQYRYHGEQSPGTRPLIIGDISTARMVHVFESQWDAFAVCDKLDMHTTPGFAVIVTRGADNGGLVARLIRQDAEVFAWVQNDAADKRKNGKTPAERWLATVAENAGTRVRSVLTPAAHKDANDWTQAGATADDFMAAIRDARIIAEPPRPLIEFRTPSQLKAFVPPAGSVIVGDCHIVRGAVFVIGGAPGVGKSRAGVALAEAGATGFEWFGLKVHRKFKTMIIQNENGEHRLKDEFSELNTDALDPWVRVCVPPPFGLTFDREDFRAVLAKAIADFKPDVIILDPWNAVARDDKAADYLETFRLIRTVIPAGDDAPALGIVAHTRKPKSDERTTGRGLLNTLAGSYALGSVPRCVFVMQAASDDPEDRRVVWTCCKNNDGELGARSAWVRSNGLFAPVSEFDWETFENAGRCERATITETDMAAVFGNGVQRRKPADAAKLLMAAPVGAGRTAAYAALKLDGRFAKRLTETDGLLSWQ